jgi:hypothetical protein
MGVSSTRHSKMCIMYFQNASCRLAAWALFSWLSVGMLNPASALDSTAKQTSNKVVAPVLNLRKTELFFGLSRPNKTKITGKEWEKFLAKEIAPRFSSGFTVMDGVGQWRMQNGLVAQENTKILVVLHPQNEYYERAVVKIIAAYKKQFTQESVMRVSSEAKVQF